MVVLTDSLLLLQGATYTTDLLRTCSSAQLQLYGLTVRLQNYRVIVRWCVLVPDWSQGVSMLSNQSAVSNNRTSVSEKAWLSVCFFFFPFSTEHTLLLLFQSKSCKTVPESRSMLAHFCSTANQWNSTNSTVICSLHRPPPPYLTMSPPRSLLPPSPLPPCPNLNVPHIPPAGSENKIVWTPHEKG